MYHLRGFCLTLLILCGLRAVTRAADPATVAQKIDAAIDQKLAAEKVPASLRASDAEFLRRLYLDLIGRIPTADEAARFLNSNDPERRSRLIDDLLARPDFGRHLGTVWAHRIMSLGTPPPTLKADGFVRWFGEQVNSGAGWDKIVGNIVTAEGDVESSPATLFYFANIENNKLEPSAVTAATAQLFLGRQIQCAECHDHPLYKWKQTDFWGMAAFYGRVAGGGGNKAGPTEITEKTAGKMAGGGGKKKKAAAPAKPMTQGTAIVIPNTNGNKGAGQVVPAKFLEAAAPRDLPQTGTLRPRLAAWMTAATNPFFAPAAVNYHWSLLMGTGFTPAVDDMREEDGASHPELLALLAREFKESGHSLKFLYRAVCNSQTYQRSSAPMEGNKDSAANLFARAAVKVLSPEQMYDSIVTALGSQALSGGQRPNPVAKKGKKNNVKAPPTFTAREQFVRLFNTKDATIDAGEYTHGIPQLLKTLNGADFHRESPLVAELVKQRTPPEKAIERLYLAGLARKPSAAEVQLVKDYLAKKASAADGYSGVLWVLLNSSEFILNH